MYHIHVGIFDQVHETGIGADLVGGHFDGCLQVFGVYIADGDQPGSLVGNMSPTHASNTNDPFGQLVAGGNKPVTSQHASGEYGQGSQASGCL